VEVKFRLEDPEGMVSRLRELGCRPGPPVEEVSYLLDYRGGSLAATGRTLRVRRSGSRLLLTAKGPRADTPGAKDRREVEVDVDGDTETLLSLLAMAGMRPGLVYRRTRRTCRLENATVCLDSMDFGTYMEIEAGSPEDLRRACRLLGLDMDRGETASYPELMARYRSGKDGP